MNETDRTRHLIDRVSRLNAADAWRKDLNPAQMSVLAYLAMANRFSRSPRHVADFLGSTRGTVSQTLKALVRKGLVTENRIESDKRSLQFDVSESGAVLLADNDDKNETWADVSEASVRSLNTALEDVLEQILTPRRLRSFGLCRTCSHHKSTGAGGYCRLLKVELYPAETGQICHEHVA